MKKKNLSVIILAILLVFAVFAAGCTSNDSKPMDTTESSDTGKIESVPVITEENDMMPLEESTLDWQTLPVLETYPEVPTNPLQSTQMEPGLEETKPEETKPEETKPEETKPEETKPEETKPEETESDSEEETDDLPPLGENQTEWN